MNNEDHTRILAEIETNRGCLENMATEDLNEAIGGWWDSWYIGLYESRNSGYCPDFDLHCDIALELDRRETEAKWGKLKSVKAVYQEKKKKMKSFYD